ncbi:hypothetical protein OEZ86_000793 [Tetradesmus obliquus]|nr:hypothetical protein OEZ86_000793 [Tetradesmus obliquus]
MKCNGTRSADLAGRKVSPAPFQWRSPHIPRTWPGIHKQQHPSLRPGIRQTECAASSAQPAGSAPQQHPVLRWFKWLPDKQAGRLVTDAWALLYSNIWAVVAIYLAKDAAAFLLHRLAHRLTNHLAEGLFGIPISTLANPWWIVADAKFMDGNIGYQAACLAVLPMFWAFPRLLGVQLSLPAAVLGGAQGAEALQRSRGLMEGFRSSYAWPYAWLIVAGRSMELLRELVLVSMPVRWWTDVIEVPLAATALFAAARLLLLRLQDLLPLAAYLQRTAQAAAVGGVQPAAGAKS